MTETLVRWLEGPVQIHLIQSLVLGIVEWSFWTGWQKLGVLWGFEKNYSCFILTKPPNFKTEITLFIHF